MKKVIGLSQHNKLILRILSGTSDNNISFAGLCNVLEILGFDCRIKGSHCIYHKEDVEEIINIQPLGSKAKAYQVKQVRNVILKYKLGGDFDV